MERLNIRPMKMDGEEIIQQMWLKQMK